MKKSSKGCLGIRLQRSFGIGTQHPHDEYQMCSAYDGKGQTTGGYKPESWIQGTPASAHPHNRVDTCNAMPGCTHTRTVTTSNVNCTTCHVHTFQGNIQHDTSHPHQAYRECISCGGLVYIAVTFGSVPGCSGCAPFGVTLNAPFEGKLLREGYMPIVATGENCYAMDVYVKGLLVHTVSGNSLTYFYPVIEGQYSVYVRARNSYGQSKNSTEKTIFVSEPDSSFYNYDDKILTFTLLDGEDGFPVPTFIAVSAYMYISVEYHEESRWRFDVFDNELYCEYNKNMIPHWVDLTVLNDIDVAYYENNEHSRTIGVLPCTHAHVVPGDYGWNAKHYLDCFSLESKPTHIRSGIVGYADGALFPSFNYLWSSI